MALSSQKYGFGIRDPGSEIRKNLSRIPGSKRHRIPDQRLKEISEKVQYFINLNDLLPVSTGV
jgi:hypothetical protein